IRRTLRCEWSPLGHLGTSLQGKRLGIFGMGRIGEAVARRARAFGLDLAYTARNEHAGIESETGARRASLEELLATSDILSIHAPLTQETQRLFSAATLRRMKSGSYLINTARGPIVDEEALCDALESGHLRGAGLDVYELEPVVNPRLRSMRQVVILPHIGSATEEARTAMARIAATNVRLVLKGRAPLNAVT
ncbi:MAG TPA: NAD(P)-dependent oxidoreductase, partial [Thermoanaerobaculia bacterium]|nr:NAD(P)-dependent oxidoreductase [Thermoanaerobaculia bacterium]